MTNLHPVIKSLISVKAEIKNLKDMEGWLNGLALLGFVDTGTLFLQFVEAKASTLLKEQHAPSNQVFQDLEDLIEEAVSLPQWEPRKVPSFWALLRQKEVLNPFMGIPPMKGFRFYS